METNKLLITGLAGRSGSAFYDVLCRNRYPGKIRGVLRETTNREMFRGSPLDLEFCIGDISDTAFLRTCIHKRLSRVWKWEIMTIVSAEETEIS